MAHRRSHTLDCLSWAFLLFVSFLSHGVCAETLSSFHSSSSSCPALETPSQVAFLVINLDRSPQRLARMRTRFHELALPDFKRVPGVEVQLRHRSAAAGPAEGVAAKDARSQVEAYAVPRLSRHLKDADYGTCLAHLKAWEAARDGDADWHIILEDDAELVSGANFTGSFPPVPVNADVVLLRPGTVLESEPVCDTTVRRATWGYGMVGYLLSRAGAARLIAGAQRGFAGPIDGHVWQHRIYTMPTDWVTHYACTHPCPRSIRTYLNGELPEGYAQPD